MTDYAATLDAPAAADLLRAADTVTLLTHAKPDGDAFASVIALTAALQHLGKTTHAAFAPPVPAAFAHLPGADLAITTRDAADLPTEVDLLVVLDTGARSQLGPLAEVVERHHAAGKPTLIVDHHLTGDLPAEHRLIDATRAANAELVADLITHLAPDLLTPDVASPVPAVLYLGIATDTGWFRFPNTTPATLRLAARLIELGVDHANLYNAVENDNRPEKLALITAALDSLEYLHAGRVALMTLTPDDFARSGALYEETERLVDLPQTVGSVHAVVLVAEVHAPDGRHLTRISLRSKPAAPAGPPAIDVARIANALGGGGHFHAAGVKRPGPLTDHLPALRRALADALEPASPTAPATPSIGPLSAS
ncbi:MAG: DHH family phosphoesterase [Planctomycetota bacterium]